MLFARFTDYDDQSFVYLLAGEKTQLVKIGYTTTDPLDRLSACQTGSPDILRYIGAYRAPYMLEQELHALLEPFHSHGEWFNIPISILKVLTRYMDTRVVSLDIRKRGSI